MIGLAGLLPGLALISALAVAAEIALTRVLAVIQWSEYGYWVISIVMAGFALSGVGLALGRGWAVAHARKLLIGLPLLMIPAAAGGLLAISVNPFNPLQLQNPDTWQTQLPNIALYYGALLPFFALAGLYISLCFVLAPGRSGLVYAADLIGAAAGAALVVVLMYLMAPAWLIPALLPLAVLAAWAGPGRWRAGGAALLLLVLCEAALVAAGPAGFNQYKPIYAPLHTPGARLLAEIPSPRGLYDLLDDFTERPDPDLSTDAGELHIPGPGRSFGLYRDGVRLAALPRPPGVMAAYAPATLDASAYALLDHPDVLLIGASGGYRIAAARVLGAAHIDALEPEPLLRRALRRGLGPSPAFAGGPDVRVLGTAPLAQVDQVARLAPARRYGLIDIAADFLEGGIANQTAFSAQAMAADLAAVRRDGIVSVPVSIRDLPVYVLRLLATARRAFQLAGIADPAGHVMVVRSAWNARILLSPTPFGAARIARLKRFANDRSFDLSWYPGIDIVAARAGIYNDLPPISFTSGTVLSDGGLRDAIADEAGAVLAGQPSASQAAFRLAPITLDRPFYYASLRLEHLGTVLDRLEVLPQGEIGQLVNLAVLAQAGVIALLVLGAPMLARRRARGPVRALVRPALYFSALGIGFLFLEIYLIAQASLWLDDQTLAFALVLTGMLFFSGLGAALAERLGPRAGRPAIALVLLVGVVALFGLPELIRATLGASLWLRGAMLLACIAPLALPLGMPFPLGLERAGLRGEFVLPWAWGLNGAMSVLATPLANLWAVSFGLELVLAGGLLLYLLAFASFLPQPETD